MWKLRWDIGINATAIFFLGTPCTLVFWNWKAYKPLFSAPNWFLEVDWLIRNRSIEVWPPLKMKNKVGYTSSTILNSWSFRDIGQQNSDETKNPMNLTLFGQKIFSFKTKVVQNLILYHLGSSKYSSAISIFWKHFSP